MFVGSLYFRGLNRLQNFSVAVDSPSGRFHKETMNNGNNGASFTNNSGGRLNKKDGITRYGNSHVKDKTS